LAFSLGAARISDAKFAMQVRAILFLVQKPDRAPPVAITLHVHERGNRHIHAGSHA
jgi:hypothetical protein